MKVEFRWIMGSRRDLGAVAGADVGAYQTLQYRQQFMTASEDGSYTPEVRWSDWMDVPVQCIALEGVA